MENIIVEVNSEPARLDHILQIAGIAGSGGVAGMMIKNNLIKINNVIATEKRKKVYLTDKVNFDEKYLIILKVSE